MKPPRVAQAILKLTIARVGILSRVGGPPAVGSVDVSENPAVVAYASRLRRVFFIREFRWPFF